MSNDLLLIFDTIGFIFGSIFSSLDSVYLGDFTIFDIFLSLIFLDIIMWFVFSVLGQQYRHDADYVRKKGVK